jgi:hypothetical protein
LALDARAELRRRVGLPAGERVQRRVGEQRGELRGVLEPQGLEREARAGEGRRALGSVARSC